MIISNNFINPTLMFALLGVVAESAKVDDPEFIVCAK